MLVKVEKNYLEQTSSAQVCVDHWPFRVRAARSMVDLTNVAALRHRAYGKHVPEVAAHLTRPEPADFYSVVLLAESNLDGQVLGTVRVTSNANHMLPLEKAVEKFGLPIPQGRHLAEASRLAIQGYSPVVRHALFKAYFEVCRQLHVDTMIVTARKPIDRTYLSLDFRDLLNEGDMIPLDYVGGIPHRILVSEVGTLRARWEAMNHPLCNFFFETEHPNLDIADVHLQPPRIDDNLLVA